MANIRVDIAYTIKDGSEIIFLAPCDCSEISGLSVYHPNGDNTEILHSAFVFKDAHGHDLSNVDNLFTAGVYVKVILNVTNGIAYIQNADTNQYLEDRFNKLPSEIRDGMVVEDIISALGFTPEQSGAAESAISDHNVNTLSHNDIRILISNLTNRLNALLDSDDATLDQMSEVVTYIKDNRELIESVTTSKINVSDIIDNLTTNVTDKPLSAAQGVALKGLIDTLQTTLTSHTHKYAGSSSAGGAATSAVKLQTARKLKVALGSTTDVTFDGSTDQISIPVSGTLPVARGGTGLTASPSLLINLASTSAANVMAASPRPGVTGILPVARGGTGQSSLANLVASLQTGGLGRIASGSYSGNGATSRTFNIGFKPKFILLNLTLSGYDQLNDDAQVYSLGYHDYYNIWFDTSANYTMYSDVYSHGIIHVTTSSTGFTLNPSNTFSTSMGTEELAKTIYNSNGTKYGYFAIG